MHDVEGAIVAEDRGEFPRSDPHAVQARQGTEQPAVLLLQRFPQGRVSRVQGGVEFCEEGWMVRELVPPREELHVIAVGELDQTTHLFPGGFVFSALGLYVPGDKTEDLAPCYPCRGVPEGVAELFGSPCANVAN